MANALNERGFYRRVVLQIFTSIHQGRGAKRNLLSLCVFEDTICGAFLWLMNGAIGSKEGAKV
jgi:hypothetical protein